MGLYNLEQLSEKLEALQPLETLKEVIADHEREAIALNQEQLYDFGIDAYGKSLTPAYAPNTVKYKRRKGERSDHVTLQDTSTFYNSMFGTLTDKSLVISANDSKTADLEFKYGKDIFGLTPASVTDYKGVILPPFYQRLRQKMGI